MNIQEYEEALEKKQRVAEPERVDTISVMRPLIAAATIILWFVLVGMGVASVWGESWQSRFFESATKVLLPLFNATIVASLTYIFGKPVVTELAGWLHRRR